MWYIVQDILVVNIPTKQSPEVELQVNVSDVSLMLETKRFRVFCLNGTSQDVLEMFEHLTLFGLDQN